MSDRDDEANRSSWPSGPMPQEPPGAFRNDMHTMYPSRRLLTPWHTLFLGMILGAGMFYVLFIIFALFFSAWAHSPEDTDPAMADWFRSLKYDTGNGGEGSCCSDKDCRVLATGDLRIVDGDAAAPNPALRDDHYEVRDPEGQRWLPVPAEHVLKRYDNPTGKVVACVSSHQVLCLVRAAGI